MEEKIFDIVKAYRTGSGGSSMVISIPRDVRETLEIENHEKFYVKSDANGRLIFERLEESGGGGEKRLGDELESDGEKELIF